MRIALLSDIHANLEALRATLLDVAQLRVGRILCLGDIVGYHADPGACIALLRDAEAVCIAGNHDRAVAGLRGTEGFSADAAHAVAWTRSRLDERARAWLAALPLERCIDGALLAVHGAPTLAGGCDMTRLDDPARRRAAFAALARYPCGAKICAVGHTHILGIHAWDGEAERALAGEMVALAPDALHIVNPGAVGQPRGTERRATWMILDLACRTVTIRRVAYDNENAIAKARAAGLMPQRSRLRAMLRRVGQRIVLPAS
jgi:diadenosine tetraphosphatase ApaH/serine/threonine PP2A family protein phosphatase